MNKTYKWGIIGPGKIAEKFAKALAMVPWAELYAVASRDEYKAKDFAERHGVKKWYNNYESLIGDPLVEVVYIATPHTYHVKYGLQCLRQHKAVLCEKPMSVNYESTEVLVKEARKEQTFLMEAMWSRFLPTIIKTIELVNSKTIGEIKHINADFGFAFPFNASSRIYNKDLGGGSLLDVGVYPLFLVLQLLGKPDQIQSFAQLSLTGVDESTTAIFKYNSGSLATIHSSVVSQTPIEATINGTDGTITLSRPWYKGSRIEVRRNDVITDTFDLPYGSNGFEFQIMEVHDCLAKGKQESDLMPLDFSLLMSKTVQQICDQAGIDYQVQS